MGFPGTVDPVNDAGLGSGLSAAGGAGDQHHAVACIRKIHYRLRNPHGFPVRDFKGDHPHHCRHRTPLPIRIYPEPGQSRHGKGKIVVPRSLIPVHGPVCQLVNLGDQVFRLWRKYPFRSNGTQTTLDLLADHAAGHNKEVRCPVRHRLLQIFHQFHCCFLLIRFRTRRPKLPNPLPPASPQWTPPASAKRYRRFCPPEPPPGASAYPRWGRYRNTHLPER